MRLPSGLVLSFQRFAWPASGVVERAPSSLGALPVGIGTARHLVLPLAADECFWIGLSLAPPATAVAVAVGVEFSDGDVGDAITGARFDEARSATVAVPATERIDGIRRPDGRFDVFVRATQHGEGRPCRGLRLGIASGGPKRRGAARSGGARDRFAVAIRLLDYATFAAETGLPPPPPLDVDSGYKGWLLP